MIATRSISLSVSTSPWVTDGERIQRARDINALIMRLPLDQFNALEKYSLKKLLVETGLWDEHNMKPKSFGSYGAFVKTYGPFDISNLASHSKTLMNNSMISDTVQDIVSDPQNNVKLLLNGSASELMNYYKDT